jgi:hypothetical protein
MRGLPLEHMTKHASLRCQQRAIPALVVDLLEQFGSLVPTCGAERIIFDKAAIRRLRRHFGGTRGLRILEPWLRYYAVVGDDGRFITVARQTRRIWRK